MCLREIYSFRREGTSFHAIVDFEMGAKTDESTAPEKIRMSQHDDDCQ